MLARRSRSTVLLCVLTLAIWGAGLAALERLSGNRQNFNAPLWIAGHLARPLLNPVARMLGGGYRPASDAQLLAFLSGASAVAAAERDLEYDQATGAGTATATQEVQRRLARLAAVDAPVEAQLGEELSATIRSQGLDSTLPVFSRVHFVWPPVSFAYDLPPLVLVRSPRDRIQLLDSQLLRNDLTLGQRSALVQRAEARGDSALVVRVGGVALYPSVVEEDDSYNDALDLIAHEWTHQYLFFHPLGVRYFESPALATINETVANMAAGAVQFQWRRIALGSRRLGHALRCNLDDGAH